VCVSDTTTEFIIIIVIRRAPWLLVDILLEARIVGRGGVVALELLEKRPREADSRNALLFGRPASGPLEKRPLEKRLVPPTRSALSRRRSPMPRPQAKPVVYTRHLCDAPRRAAASGRAAATAAGEGFF
jgi:hypothetical protein